MEIDFNQRIDISKIQSLFLGSKNENLQKYLSEEINNIYKTPKSNERNPTIQNLFSNLCPNFILTEFDFLFNDFRNKIAKLTFGINMINPNKSEEYFSSLIHVLCLKYVYGKLHELTNFHRERLIKVKDEINTYDNKKYSLSFKNQVEYLINENISLRHTNTPPKSNRSYSKNNYVNIQTNYDKNSSKTNIIDYSNTSRKPNPYSTIDSKRASQNALPNYSSNTYSTSSPYVSKEYSSKDRTESRLGNRPNISFTGRQPIMNSFIKNISDKNLTQNIWPKSKMLLSIVSKLFKEKFISLEQRGILKELILDKDHNLLNILTTYENTRNYKNLCESITKLISLNI